MTPFYFGSGERRLFGILTPKQKTGPRDRGVILCYPWGMEYLRAHRSMRLLAAQLSRAGIDVLRFDYYGTGDSNGEMTMGDVAGWCDDIGTAIEELRDTSGITQVGLVGLRLGAALAAVVAAKRPGDVDSLVLWDPVISGKDYVAEIEAPPSGDLHLSASGVLHIEGFPLSTKLREQLLALDLLPFAPLLPKRTVAIVSEPLPSHAAFEAAVTVEKIEAERAWYQAGSFSVGAVPTTVLNRIVEWHG